MLERAENARHAREVARPPRPDDREAKRDFGIQLAYLDGRSIRCNFAQGACNDTMDKYAVGEDRGTLEDVVEPYVIHRGFLNRTPRGRVATRVARDYFEIPLPGGVGSQPKLL
jgi:hypothetical protein